MPSTNRYSTGTPDRSLEVNVSYCSHSWSVISETAVREITNSPVTSLNASSTSRVDMPRAYIPRHQTIQDIRVAFQESHQRRTERLRGVTDLGDPDRDLPLRSRNRTLHISVTPTPLTRIRVPTFVTAPITHKIGLLGLQQLLDHPV